MDELDFFDEVIVTTELDQYEPENDQLGTIVGKAEMDDGEIKYAVLIDILGQVLTYPAKALKRTGRKRNPKDIYPGDHIRVRIDPDTGESEILNDV
jgi:hypothetical protein